MDSERLAQLQELMKEARQNGQLEKALLQSSAMPVPSPPSRRNIPLNEYQQMMAALPKQGPVHVSEMALTIPEDVKIAAMSQMEQPGCRPKAPYHANSAMAQVAASSDKPPVAAPVVSTASTDPRELQGINRMRLAHERGDPVPSMEDAARGRAKAAIYKAGGILQEARAKHPGHVVAGYVNASNSPKRNKTVPRQPVMVSLCDNILDQPLFAHAARSKIFGKLCLKNFAVQTKHGFCMTTFILIMCSLTHFNIKVWVGGFPFVICGKTTFALPVKLPTRGLFPNFCLSLSR